MDERAAFDQLRRSFDVGRLTSTACGSLPARTCQSFRPVDDLPPPPRTAGAYPRRIVDPLADSTANFPSCLESMEATGA